MTALFLHLSDMHVLDESSAILARAPSIVDAVKNLDHDLDLVVVVVSGDLTFSGTAEQFCLVADFLRAIKETIAESARSPTSNQPIPVVVVAAPGNHDCDFSLGTGLRSILSEAVLRDHNQLNDPDVLSELTRVHENFFQFRDEVCSSPQFEPSSLPFSDRVAYTYTVAAGNDWDLQITCLNTALLSSLREQQGSLIFPADALPQEDGERRLRLVVFHHTLPWLEATSLRDLRRRIEAFADLAFSGHDHDAARQETAALGGQRVTYIEGGALQDASDSLASTFNAVVVDLPNRKQKFAQFAWDGAGYSLVRAGAFGDQERGIAWEELQLSRLRKRGQFEFTEQFLAFLDDPGIALPARGATPAKLTDIFVHPDLREVPHRGEKGTHIVRGENLTELLSKSAGVLITSDDKAGKTSLAKSISQELHERGFVPVFIDGAQNVPRPAKMDNYLEALVAAQYGREAIEAYRRVDRTRRFFVVDDVHRLRLDPDAKRTFIGNLTKAGRLLLFGNDLSVGIENLTEPGAQASLQHFRLQPLGHARRDNLIERWLALRAGGDVAPGDTAHRIAASTKILNTVFANNYVPSYPVYLIAVLSAQGAVAQVDNRIGTHGYFYELLIRTAVARGRTSTAFDIMSAYLAFMSFRIFSAATREISSEDFKRAHRDYEKHYAISLDLDRMKSELVSLGILEKIEDTFRFRYPYYYYYFVACYLRDHITESAIRQKIDALSKSLEEPGNADVFLFLAHVSKDPLLVETLVRSARELFPEAPLATLEDEARFLAEIGKAPKAPEYVEESPAEKRQRRLETLDTAEDGRDTASERGQLHVAFRTIQILGQVLRNFPGSIPADEKEMIASECYGLGRRVISSVLTEVRRHSKVILLGLTALVREQGKVTDQVEAEAGARELLALFTYVFCIDMVRRIAGSTGSSELQPTHDKLREADESTAVRLIHVALTLEHSRDFPLAEVKGLARDLRRNPLGLFILRWLVVENLDLFSGEFQDFRLAQQICEIVGVPYRKVHTGKTVRRMIEGG